MKGSYIEKMKTESGMARLLSVAAQLIGQGLLQEMENSSDDKRLLLGLLVLYTDRFEHAKATVARRHDGSGNLRVPVRLFDLVHVVHEE